jgi:hypothetical protein
VRGGSLWNPIKKKRGRHEKIIAEMRQIFILVAATPRYGISTF